MKTLHNPFVQATNVVFSRTPVAHTHVSLEEVWVSLEEVWVAHVAVCKYDSIQMIEYKYNFFL